MSSPSREVTSACSKQLESWPPENPTTTCVPRAKRSGRREAAARMPRFTDSRARTLTEEVIPPLPPRRRRWRGWGWRGRDRGWLGSLRNQYQRMVARLDQPELFARNRLDGAVGARALDLLLQLDVVGPQAQNLRPQRVCFAVQAVIVDRLLAGRDQRVQQQRHDEHRCEAECQGRWADRSAQDDRLRHAVVHDSASAILRPSAGWLASSTSDQRGG